MDETEIREGLVRFDTGEHVYVAAFLAPHPSGVAMVDEGLWRLSLRVWQSHRLGRDIQRKARSPRLKRLATLATLEECREHIRQLEPQREL